MRLAQGAPVDAFDLRRHPLEAPSDERVLEREKAGNGAPPAAQLAIRLDARLARGLGLGDGAPDHVGSLEAGGQDRLLSGSRSLRDRAIDTTPASGELMFHLF